MSEALNDNIIEQIDTLESQAKELKSQRDELNKALEKDLISRNRLNDEFQKRKREI